MGKMRKFVRDNNGWYFAGSFSLGILIVCMLYIVVLTGPVEYRTRFVHIPEGFSAKRIALLLEKEGVIKDKDQFLLATRLLFRSKSLKAGKFELKGVRNLFELILKLSSPSPYYIKVTIPEGATSRHIAQIVEHRLGIRKEDFLNKVSDKNLLIKYGINSPSLEGYLFPDTYFFGEADSAERVIEVMVDRFFEVVNDSIRKEIRKKGMNLNQVLTLASIVEGECKFDFERPIVASLYLNRLKGGMRLEADPTIQYIIPDGPRRLYSKDLKIDSPYNTYKYRGLPPGPVNNPGMRSILAVLNPAKTDFLYMVANGDGTHTFTKDYNEFLKAKRNLQRLRKLYSPNGEGVNN